MANKYVMIGECKLISNEKLQIKITLIYYSMWNKFLNIRKLNY